MKVLFILAILSSVPAFAEVSKVFNVAPFAVTEDGEVVYSRQGNIILESNVLTKAERTFSCDFKLGTTANEILFVYELNSTKMTIVKETLEVGGWIRTAWSIDLKNGDCNSINGPSDYGPYQPHFKHTRQLDLPNLGLKVVAPFMYSQGGKECYGIRTVKLATNNASKFKWDKFCGQREGVNMLAVQDTTNAALLFNTGEDLYGVYIGADGFNSEQAFKYVDQLKIRSNEVNFVNLKNHPNKILLFTYQGLGKHYLYNDRGVYLLDIE